MTITLDNHYVTIKHLNYLKQQTLQFDGIFVVTIDNAIMISHSERWSVKVLLVK